MIEFDYTKSPNPAQPIMFFFLERKLSIAGKLRILGADAKISSSLNLLRKCQKLEWMQNTSDLFQKMYLLGF